MNCPLGAGREVLERRIPPVRCKTGDAESAEVPPVPEPVRAQPFSRAELRVLIWHP